MDATTIATNDVEPDGDLDNHDTLGWYSSLSRKIVCGRVVRLLWETNSAMATLTPHPLSPLQRTIYGKPDFYLPQ